MVRHTDQGGIPSRSCSVPWCLLEFRPVGIMSPSRNGKGVGTKIVDENGQVVKMQGPWTVYVIGALPLNAISRAWGWANNLTLPVWFRPFGFKLYAYIFGCNLDEMKAPTSPI